MRKIMRNNFKIVVGKNIRFLTILDPFCMKQFKSSGSNRAVIDFDHVEFEKKVNEVYNEENLQPGYAPFCKHLFIENFTDTPIYYQEITEENQHLIR